MRSISIRHPLPHPLALALALAQALPLALVLALVLALALALTLALILALILYINFSKTFEGYFSKILLDNLCSTHVVIFQNLLNLRSAEVTLEQRPPPPSPNGPDSIHTHPDK